MTDVPVRERRKCGKCHYVVDVYDQGFGIRWKDWIGKLTLDELNSLQAWMQLRHVKSFDVRQTSSHCEVEQVRRPALQHTTHQSAN